MTNYVYLIMQYNPCGDTFYEPQQNILRIYHTKEEAVLKIYKESKNTSDISYIINNGIDKYGNVEDSRIEIIKYRLDDLDFDDINTREVIYNSNIHIINNQFEILTRAEELKFPRKLTVRELIIANYY